VKALTLHQPWASAIAEGIKTIETRSWSTSYRGPLAIHAGKSTDWEGVAIDGWSLHAIDADVPEVRRLGSVHNGELVPDRYERRFAFPAPLGAVVATAILADVVPIATANHEDHLNFVCPHIDGALTLYRFEDGPWRQPTVAADMTDQRPWGDFSPGRFAWLLDDVRKLDEPIPARGRQGLWEWDESEVAA
jgi:hypothetical protein